MSGEFRPEQNLSIESTDDPDLARAHGLTSFNKRTGQYERPRSDAGTRDGEDAQEQRRFDALAEGDEQQKTEQEREAAAKHVREQAAADAAKAADEQKSKAPAKATGSKASQSKTGDDGKSDSSK